MKQITYTEMIKRFEILADAHGEDASKAFHNASRSELADAHGAINNGRSVGEVFEIYFLDNEPVVDDEPREYRTDGSEIMPFETE